GPPGLRGEKPLGAPAQKLLETRGAKDGVKDEKREDEEKREEADEPDLRKGELREAVHLPVTAPRPPARRQRKASRREPRRTRPQRPVRARRSRRTGRWRCASSSSPETLPGRPTSETRPWGRSPPTGRVEPSREGRGGAGGACGDTRAWGPVGAGSVGEGARPPR